MERPLIAIFCNSFPPEGGGASGRIYNLAVLLRSAGYRVQVVAGMPNYPTGKIFPTYRSKVVVDEEVDGIAVRRVWLSPSNSASTLARSWSMMSFVLSLKLLGFGHVRKMKPALVIVSSPPLPMAATAMRYFKKRGCRVLLNVSDIWPLSANALGVLRRRQLYHELERVSQRMYDAADAITTQSGETMEHIRQHCAQMPPAMVYRNLPVVVAVDMGAPSLRDKVIIVYPGHLGHAQGLLALCEAIDFGQLNAELHIYGEGPEREAIEALCVLRRERGIMLHKPVGAGELFSILQGAQAVLIPLISPIEGALPSKLFTAMQAGAPVLYSGGGEGAALVKEHQLGWIAEPGNYAAIAEQFGKLAAMAPDAIVEWRERIRTVAEQHFNKPEQDRQFLGFLSGLID